jgi:hypothetical protein
MRYFVPATDFHCAVTTPSCTRKRSEAERFGLAAFDDGEVVIHGAGFAKKLCVEPITVHIDDQGTQDGHVGSASFPDLATPSPTPEKRRRVPPACLGKQVSADKGVVFN